MPGVTDAAREAVPAPPSRLLARTRRRWTEYWSSGLADPITPIDRPALDRLFQMVDERDRMRGLTAEGLSDHLRAMTTNVDNLEDRFALTRLGRLRLGLILGDDIARLAELALAIDDREAAIELLVEYAARGR